MNPTVASAFLLVCLSGCGGGRTVSSVPDPPATSDHDAPLIGVTGYVLGARPEEGVRHGSFRMTRTYRDALVGAGALAVHLVPVAGRDVGELIGRLDGLVLTGGPDIDPEAYGESPHPSVVRIPRERQQFDLALIREAMARRMPILGICLGSQEVNVALGGSLVQDIPTEVEGDVGHRQLGTREVEGGAHEITLVPGTPLAQMYGTSEIRVNSLHHQASDRLGAGLEVAARARDGVIEGFFLPGYPYLIGVQFHPEMQGNPESLHRRLFQSFVRAAHEYRLRRQRIDPSES